MRIVFSESFPNEVSRDSFAHSAIPAAQTLREKVASVLALAEGNEGVEVLGATFRRPSGLHLSPTLPIDTVMIPGEKGRVYLRTREAHPVVLAWVDFGEV